jgi:hypothetical protein
MVNYCIKCSLVFAIKGKSENHVLSNGQCPNLELMMQYVGPLSDNTLRKVSSMLLQISSFKFEE